MLSAKFKLLMLSLVVLIIYSFVLNFIDLRLRVSGYIGGIITVLIAVILDALLVKIKNWDKI